MLRISVEDYEKEPRRYRLVSGNMEGAPLCPYGNHFQWVGYDLQEKIFVRFTKGLFKKLIREIEASE